MSGDISLPKCILDLLAVLGHHGSVVNIGDEYECGLLIRLRRCVGYDPKFVRGDPSPS